MKRKNGATAGGGKAQGKNRPFPRSPFFDGSRWRAFLHSRLLLGLLPAVSLSFGVVFLAALAVGFDPAGKALLYGLLAGAVSGLGWLLGIWAALGPYEEEPEETEERAAPARTDRFAAWLWVAGLLFLLLAFSDVVKLIDGTESWGKATVAIVSKLLVLFAVALPVWLNYRKR